MKKTPEQKFVKKQYDARQIFELERTINLLQYELNGYTCCSEECGYYAQCQESCLPPPCSRKSSFFDHRNTFWGYLKACARLFKVLRKSKEIFFSLIIGEY